MKSHVRRLSVGGSGVIAAVLVASAVAWACTPSASVAYCAGTTEGVAGTRVTLCGQAFQSGRQVQVHWGATTGPVLAATTVTGGSFQLPVRVPVNAAAGRNAFVLAFSYSNQDTAADTSDSRQVAFNVLPARTAEETVVTPPAVTAQTEGVSSGAEPDSAFPAAAAAPVAAPSGPVATVTEAAPSSAIPAPRSLPVSANPGAVRQSGRTVFGGSVAPEAPVATTATAAEDQAPRVAAGTATGDLWSGLASGSNGPAFGLGDSPSTSSDSSAGLAAALLGAGLMALFAGFGIAELGRRRALAHAADR